MIAMRTCTLVKPNNNPGGSWKTLRSLNLRRWHCKTLFIVCGATDKIQRQKIGFVGPIAAQDRRTSSRCCTHQARTRSRLWCAELPGSRRISCSGKSSCHGHNLGKMDGFHGQTQCVKKCSERTDHCSYTQMQVHQSGTCVLPFLLCCTPGQAGRGDLENSWRLWRLFR